MSIAFNQDGAIRGMFYYNSTAGTYTDRNLTTGDYFSDSSVAGDCLYFSVGGTAPLTECPYQGLKLYVGTALTCSAITLAWEYQSNTAWYPFSGVVDNTNSFRNTGANYITWTIPANWYYNTYSFADYNFSGTRRGLLVRARIVSVTSLTEGGANSTTAVQYKDYKITATNEGSLTMASLYAADVAGGWGVITRLENNANYDVYKIQCNIHLAGTTSFTSSREIIIQGDDSYPWTFTTASGTTFQLGVLDSTTGYGRRGSTFIYYTNDCYVAMATLGGTTKIYGSNVHKQGDRKSVV